MNTGGKGSKPRPLSVPRKQFEDNWDKIFKKPVKTYAGGKPHYIVEADGSLTINAEDNNEYSYNWDDR